jgi:F0F1-type ATP synthase membrane subunit b/b'
MVALLSIPITAAGSQNDGRRGSNPKTSDLGSQSQRDMNVTQSSENSGLNEPAGVGQTDGEQKIELLKRLSLIEMVAEESGISTIAAYRISVAFNFALLVTLIVIPLKSWLPPIIRNRTELIRQSLESAGKGKCRGDEAIAGHRIAFGQDWSEIMALQLRADREWKAKDDLIRTTIVEDERRIAERIERDIAVAVDRARHELKAYAADLAVTLAAARLHESISTDQALVRNFIDQLGRSQR